MIWNISFFLSFFFWISKPLLYQLLLCLYNQSTYIQFHHPSLSFFLHNLRQFSAHKFAALFFAQFIIHHSWSQGQKFNWKLTLTYHIGWYSVKKKKNWGRGVFFSFSQMWPQRPWIIDFRSLTWSVSWNISSFKPLFMLTYLPLCMLAIPAPHSHSSIFGSCTRFLLPLGFRFVFPFLISLYFVEILSLHFDVEGALFGAERSETKELKLSPGKYRSDLMIHFFCICTKLNRHYKRWTKYFWAKQTV